ncbi:pentatricopeptide repeat-containing protein At4g14820 [Phragmites australis]|uniref:pentatricopeptide repeat-containing protein At4g14820 n=1 Tax=Phragmites australis TaxID=29695 RepID=UPI002D780AA3|nr:pentatricopeptide repeat-containing protein At4g14820 [Phragmites australis]
MEAHAAHHLRQLRAHLLRRGHPFPPAPHPDPDRAHLSVLRAAAAPRLALAACACLRRAGLPPPGRRALPALLRAARCEGEASSVLGGAHGLAVRVGVQGDGFVGTALVGAYAACGCVGDARKVFDEMGARDVLAWGVMLDSYCQTWNYKEALLLFGEMKRSGVVPDQLILATVLSACRHTRHLRTGKAIHSYMLVSDILINAHLSSALINLYASCVNMDMAEKLYNGMPRKDLVSSTAMVFGYCKNGKVEIARSVFDEMPEKDVVCWSAMVSGYAQSNQPNEALNLFKYMQERAVRPDQVTVLSVISACANLGSLDKAIWIHSFTENNGFSKRLHICNALIDMFSKCGGLTLALNVFNTMPGKNVITWTSMITAFAMHGDGKSALGLFEQMKSEGVEPNEVTFLGLLYACCHSGLVDEGRSLFRCMVQEYKIEPKHEHYGCMVDLLGRAKLLQEAVELIESMRLGPNVAVWGSLLAACWMHGDLKLGAFAAKKVLELDPQHDGASVLLSKIYAKSGNWNDARKVMEVMKLQGVSKETGSSWMERNDTFDEFAAGGEKHSENDKILLELNGKLLIEDVRLCSRC